MSPLPFTLHNVFGSLAKRRLRAGASRGRKEGPFNFFSGKRITYSIGNGMFLCFNFPLDIGVVDMFSFMSFLTFKVHAQHELS